MMRHVGLLRGINVGGHRRVPMADLRALCAEIGFTDVATYIQSGNVVFASRLGAPAAETKLERAIEDRFGFAVDVVVRTADAWTACAATNPFPAESAAEPNRVMLLVTKAPPLGHGPIALAARAAAGEHVVAAGGAVWVHFPQGAGASKLTPALIDRLLGSPTTSRNWTTVVALQRMVDGTP